MYFRNNGERWFKSGVTDIDWTQASVVVNDQNAILRPYFVTGGNAMQAVNATVRGAAYQVVAPIDFNTINARQTNNPPGAPTWELAIYQNSDGRPRGPVPQIALVIGIPDNGGSGNIVISMGGTISLVPGVAYFIYSSGAGGGTAASMRAFTVATIDLMNANVPTSLAPTEFTTNLPAGALPPTFDFEQGAPGVVATTSNIALMIRLEMI